MEDQEIKRAWALLEKAAGKHKPEWKDSMLEHARVVHDASLFLAGLFPADAPVDEKVIRLGAILHDVGRSWAERIVEHGVKSGEIIREAGFPEAVARIGETHLGVGITKTEAVGLGLPERDFIPETTEERIVCYVDNLLYYIRDEDRHELRDTDAVVERFTEELGEAYGKRARKFMEEIEGEIGAREFLRFRDFVDDENESLSARYR